MRLCTTGTIMAKSVVTVMIVCATLAVCAGNADAHVHKSHVTRTASTLTSLTAKGGPLHDCVHVTFPQCDDRGFNRPNG
jgi:hypothetical protein